MTAVQGLKSEKQESYFKFSSITIIVSIFHLTIVQSELVSAAKESKLIELVCFNVVINGL